MSLSTECSAALLSFKYPSVIRISYFVSGVLFMVERDQTETEKHTGTVRRMKEKNPESENHANKGTPVKHVMTDHERETETETETETGGTGTKQKRGSETEQGTERSQRKVIEEVEAEIDHLTGGKAGSQDILKIVPPRLVHRIY